MVGVPGRSNACLTCRDRRIKCDGRKPLCARCTRNGHTCRGYERPRIFVNQFLAADSQAAPSQALSHNRWTVLVPPRPYRQLHGQVDSIPACPSPKVHERQQLLARFISSFCPSDVAPLKQSERLHHYWVQVLPGLGGSSNMLDAAISSLTTAYLGQMEGDVALQKQAISLYGHALHELSKITTAPGFCADDHTLASIMCLGMSEIYFSPMAKGQGWVSHNKGGGELLRLRGPSIMNSDLGRSLFLRFRVTGLYTAIGTKKPFCFADPALRSISKIANKNYYDFLVEEMVDIPGLLEDIGSLFKHGAAAERKWHVQRLLSRAIRVKRNLNDWLSSFRIIHPYPYTWGLSDTHQLLHLSHNGTIFPQRLQFINLLVAQAMIHYWAAMVIVLRCVMICQDILAEDLHVLREDAGNNQVGVQDMEGFREESLSSEPRSTALRFADCICYSAEYCVSNDKGAAGPIVLLFPLWIAKDLYSHEGDELSKRKEAFCVEVFGGIMNRGMHFSKALIDLSTKDQV